ncbi:MAG: GIY-YIG nuclease family protein [Firmicutes bacterium]|nr:GIY-YIG nuclease family protein [Bacillota bacterium]
MKKGRVYLVTNPAFPHLFKIGRTSKDSTEKRGLTASNVPEDYEIVREYECADPKKIEELFHKTYANFRHQTATGRRTEFFYIVCLTTAVEWMDTLKGLGLVDVTEEAVEEVEEEVESDARYDGSEGRRERSTFEMLDIPIGAILTFTKDKNVTVKVVEGNKIMYKGEVLSLTATAKKLLKERKLYATNIAGTAYFKYEDETLRARRLRMENHKHRG